MASPPQSPAPPAATGEVIVPGASRAMSSEAIDLNASGDDFGVAWDVGDASRLTLDARLVTGTWATAVVELRGSIDGENYALFSATVEIAGEGLTADINVEAYRYVTGRIKTVEGSAATARFLGYGYTPPFDAGLYTTAAAAIADNAIVRGDGGARGLQGSSASIADNGVVSVPGIGDGGLASYDFRVGDVTTPSYGMIQIGNGTFGRTSYNVGNLDLDGSLLWWNNGAPPTSFIEFAMADSTNSIRFALAKPGVGNATLNPRSMLVAGPAVLDDTIVTVGYWQGLGIFGNLACDTGTDGADLGVQNDLEVEGDIFVDSIKGSTDDTDITLAPHGTGDVVIVSADLDLGGGDIVNAGTIGATVLNVAIAAVSSGMSTDSIAEYTANAGVAVDGLLIKDGTVPNNLITNAKLADVATSTLKGRVTAATGDPEDLTGTQATTLLNAFTSALKGLAPASGGGTANFLRADGTWAAPGGGGGGRTAWTITGLKTSGYTASAFDVVPCDCSGGSFTVTLPAGSDGDEVIVFLTSAGTNYVTMFWSGFDAIVVDAQRLQGGDNTFLHFIFRGTDSRWYPISHNGAPHRVRRIFQGRISATQNHNPLPLVVDWDVEDTADNDVYTHSTVTNPEQITLELNGVYRVSYSIGIDNTGYNNRWVTRGWLKLGGTLVPGSYDMDYGRYSTYGDYASVGKTMLIDATAAQVLTVGADLKTATGAWNATVNSNISTFLDACHVSLEYLGTDYI